MDEQLKQCPFCGSANLIRMMGSPKPVHCNACGADSNHWQRRTPGPATRAMLEWCVNHPGFSASPTFQAFIDEWDGPAAPPTPEQPEPSSPWTCRTCGEPVRIADDLKPRHLRNDINRAHAAELSDEDRKILADGLRLTD